MPGQCNIQCVVNNAIMHLLPLYAAGSRLLSFVRRHWPHSSMHRIPISSVMNSIPSRSKNLQTTALIHGRKPFELASSNEESQLFEGQYDQIKTVINHICDTQRRLCYQTLPQESYWLHKQVTFPMKLSLLGDSGSVLRKASFLSW